MNVPLPLPNPTDWMSPAAAGLTLRVAPMTLLRMATDGRLTRYKISGSIPVYWRPEVEALAAARQTAKSGVR